MARRKQDKASLPPDIGMVEVPNPHGIRVPDLHLVRGEQQYHPDRIVVARSLRDDPLARLHHRNQISDAQFHAGRRWQSLYEASQVGRIRSGGDLKEPVDGNPPTKDPLNPRQQRAAAKIAFIDKMLGPRDAQLIRYVLVDGHDYARICRLRGIDPTEGNKKYFGHCFRDILDTVDTLTSGTGTHYRGT